MGKFLDEERGEQSPLFSSLDIVAQYKTGCYCQCMDIFKKVKTGSGPLGDHEYWIGHQRFEQRHICMLGDILYVSGNGIRKPSDVDACSVDNNSCFLYSNVWRHTKQMEIFAYPHEQYVETIDHLLKTGVVIVLESKQERFAKTGQRERLFAFNMEKEGVIELCKEAVKQKMATPIM